MKPRAQSLIKSRSRFDGQEKKSKEVKGCLATITKLDGFHFRKRGKNQNQTMSTLTKINSKICYEKRMIPKDTIEINQLSLTNIRNRIPRDKDKYLEKEIKQHKKMSINNHFNINYLKKNLVKSSCTLSLLDFWTNEMLAHASKFIQKPKILKNTEKSIYLKPKPKISKSQIIREKLKFSNFSDYLEKIDKICESTNNDTSLLKSKINETLIVINKPSYN